MMLPVSDTKIPSLAEIDLAGAQRPYQQGYSMTKFGTRVPVNPHNSGVVITHEYIGPPSVMGGEVVKYDECIRNRQWNHLWPNLENTFINRRHDPGHGGSGWPSVNSQKSLSSNLQGVPRGGPQWHANHEAQNESWQKRFWQTDIKASLKMFKPKTSKETLDQANILVAHVLASEVMNEEGVKEFFSRPEAVSYETTRSVERMERSIC